MDILITAATSFELKPICFVLSGNRSVPEFPFCLKTKWHNIDFQVTGIGLVHTAFHLTKALNRKKYDLVINAGIAGAFNRNLAIGEVVLVRCEEFGDLGIESENGFESLFDAGFYQANENPFKNARLECKIPESIKEINLNKVNGLTSNTAHGKQQTIDFLSQKYQADIESMEGAAFFYVCLMEKVPFVEIRAVSNYVESRDTSKWNMKLALDNLSKKLAYVIDNLEQNSL